MGGCFSKNSSTPPETPALQQLDLKSEPQKTKNDIKKEIFVIKHRISHDEIDNEKNPNPSVRSRSRSSSCSKEEVDAILIQCGRLSRSNSAGAQNPNRRRRRRYSRSKRSFDFDLNNRLKIANSDEDGDALNHRQQEVRVSSRRNSRSSSKERRISISPSRRSESPFPSNLNTTGGSCNKPPAKMVSVPATDKSNNNNQLVGGSGSGSGTVKRIHVKRNPSPAKTPTLRVFKDNQQGINNTRETDHTRTSLQEIDNNAPAKTTRDLPVTTFDHHSPCPPSYASLLLEDIYKFHQNNTTAEPPAFALPECVTKACSIMEAVANLNSNSNSNSNSNTTSSLCSEDKWRNLTTTDKKDSQESSTSAQVTIRECDVSQIKLGGFQRDFMDYPRKGKGRKNSYSIPKSTSAALI